MNFAGMIFGRAIGHDASTAYRANKDGKVVVGTNWLASGNGKEAFRCTSAGMVGLGVLPGMTTKSSAWDVSRDGTVVVGTSEDDSGVRQAFVRTERTGMVGLPFQDDFRVSACGNVIVGGNAGAAVRWTLGKGVGRISSALESAGVSVGGRQLVNATAVSADGATIAGDNLDSEGLWDEAWIATLPVPEAQKPGQMCKL